MAMIDRVPNSVCVLAFINDFNDLRCNMIILSHVYVPEPGSVPWVEAFLDQFTVFPNGAHDDMVDASSQALSYLLQFLRENGKENDGSAEGRAVCPEFQ